MLPASNQDHPPLASDGSAGTVALSAAPAGAAITQPMSPVSETERIEALDVLRGFALLGIFMVNMQFFAMPFMQGVHDPSLVDAAASERYAWAFVKTLFEYKFVSLFSLLFGIGFTVQLMRARARGSSFIPMYLRRVGVLFVIGLVHALLLWYGDILLMYSVISLLLLATRSLSARTVLVLAAGAWLVGTMLLLGFTTLQVLGEQYMQQIEAREQAQSQHQTQTRERSQDQPEEQQQERAPAQDQAQEQAQPISEPPETAQVQHTIQSQQMAAPALQAGDAAEHDSGSTDKMHASHDDAAADLTTVAADALPQVEAAPQRLRFRDLDPRTGDFDPYSERWMAAESAAYKHGPFSEAFIFRAISFAYALIFAVVGFGWHILAMFLLGSALMKMNFFSPSRLRWHRILAFVFLPLGLLIEGGGVQMMLQNQMAVDWSLLPLALAHEVGSVMLCLGYVGLWTLIVHSGVGGWIVNALARTGRMALTNYLMQTVIATSLMYWWGLGWFGEVSRAQQVGLVLLIYLLQVVFSVLWMSVFSIGPLEWLWRSLTYLRVQPVRQRVAPG